jgi:hypothetical protein
LRRRARRPEAARWELLLRQIAEGPAPDERAERRIDARLEHAIAEVDDALASTPRDPALHAYQVRLYRAGSERLFLSGRLLHHARAAASLAAGDPATLAIAGEALSFRALIANDRRLWREGVALLRRAYAFGAAA